MRTFGKDTPEFFEFKIAGSKKTYRIPTQASIGYGFTDRMVDVAAMEDEDKKNAAAVRLQLDILTTYIGPEAAEFPAEAVGELFVAWLGYSEETTGLEPGESQGSSES